MGLFSKMRRERRDRQKAVQRVIWTFLILTALGIVGFFIFLFMLIKPAERAHSRMLDAGTRNIQAIAPQAGSIAGAVTSALKPI